MPRRGNLQSHEPNRQNSERLERFSSIWPHFNAQKVDIFRSVVLGDRLLLWRPDRAVFTILVQAFTWSVFSFSSQIRRMYMSLHVNVFACCQCVRGVSAQPVDGQEVVSSSRKMATMTTDDDQRQWHHTQWLPPPAAGPLCFWFLKSASCFLWFLSFEIWRGRLLHQRRVDHRLAQEVWHRRDGVPLQETLRRARVFRGAGSHHWKPDCHGNNVMIL